MCEVPIFYATSEGQTRRIAERQASRIRERGLESEAVQIGMPDASPIDWTRVRGACLGASLHAQEHQASALAFARAHKDDLSRHPSLFFSVSLAAASKEPKSAAAARRLADAFAASSGWQPSRIACVAGRLAYTQYGWIIRFFMRRIALKQGGSGDTSRDHEYTDWAQVVRLADELVDDIHHSEPAGMQASA